MFKRHYKPDSRFVHTLIAEDITNDQLRDHVVAYNEEASDRTALLELADCRELKDVSGLTVHGCVQSAQLESGQPRALGGKLAILVNRQLEFGMARAYATMASETRSGVNVFYVLDEALQWLDPEEGVAAVQTFIDANYQDLGQ